MRRKGPYYITTGGPRSFCAVRYPAMEVSSSSQPAPRLSTDSTDTFNSDAPLILSFSPDNDHEPLPDVSDDDEDEDQLYDHSRSPSRSSLPALSTSAVFVFLMAPCLKLGAISLANNNSNFPFQFGIASVVVFGLLSLFSRQLLYLLSRYLRKGELGEIVFFFDVMHA